MIWETVEDYMYIMSYHDNYEYDLEYTPVLLTRDF